MEKKPLVGLAALAVANLLVFAAPFYYIMPLVAHRQSLLTLAFWSQRIAPGVAAVSLVCAIWLLRPQWKAGKLPKTAVPLFIPILMNLPVGFINPVEWMFAPAEKVRIAPIHQFADIEETDMVIGIMRNGQSRAYPVRYLAYHHMLNDQLGGLPVLPTY